MTATTILCKRQGRLAPSEFTRRLREHGTELLLNIPEFRESIRHYIQNEIIGPGPRGETFPFDGVCEIEHSASRSEPDFWQSQIYRRPVLSDDATFLDLDRSLTFRAEQSVILEGHGDVKLMIFSRRNPRLTHREYVEYWSTNHVRVIRSQADFFGLVRRYAQSYIEEGSLRTLSGTSVGDVDPYDGVVQLWFDSADAARRSFSSEGYRTAITADEPEFVAVGKSIAFLSREVRLL
jgi:hypothetical protein